MKVLNPQAFWDSVPDNSSPIWPVICLDFNGVFDKYAGWNGQVEDYPIADGIEEFLTALRTDYNTIIVQTATMPLERVIRWLKEHNLEQYIDYVSNHKPPADCYVDDRAVCHRGNFEETLLAVKNFKPHWQADNG